MKWYVIDIESEIIEEFDTQTNALIFKLGLEERDRRDDDVWNSGDYKVVSSTYYENMVKEKEEPTYPFTAFHLQKELGWKGFCELTGVSYYACNEGFEIKDSEVFHIPEFKAKKFNLV